MPRAMPPGQSDIGAKLPAAFEKALVLKPRKSGADRTRSPRNSDFARTTTLVMELLISLTVSGAQQRACYRRSTGGRIMPK